MGYAINSSGIPTLRTHADAKAKWETTKPWRGAIDTNVRPIQLRRFKNQTIRMDVDVVRCKLYHTDLVTYHPDDSIELVGYNSQSSNAFTRALVPSGIEVNYTDKLGYVISVQRRKPKESISRSYVARVDYTYVSWRDQQLASDAYCFGHNIVLRQDEIGWCVDEEASDLRTFSYPSLNRTRAKAAMEESRAADFIAWCDARVKLHPDDWMRMVNDPDRFKFRFDNDDIIPMLKDPTQWDVLARHVGQPNYRHGYRFANGTDVNFNTYREPIKQLVYRHFKCVDVTEHLTVPASDLNRFRAAYRRYSWAV